MKHIIIDTNVIHGDYFLGGSNILTLCTTANCLGHKIYVPQVVDEFVRQYNEDVQNHCSDFNSKIDKVHRLCDLKEVYKKLDPQVFVDSYPEKLRSRWNWLNIQVLPYPQTSHERLVHKELNKIKLFKDSKKGYRDALIWETVIEFAKKMSEEDSTVFISSNTKDFGDGKNTFHPDLKADCKSIGVNEERLQYISDIEDYKDRTILSKQNRLDAITDDLNKSGRYGRIDFIASLETYLSTESTKEFVERFLQRNELFASCYYECPELLEIGKPMIKFSYVCELTENTIALSCEIAIPVDIAIAVRKDYLPMFNSHRILKDVNPEWDKYYARGVDSSTMFIGLNMLVDKDFTTISTIDRYSKGIALSSGCMFMEHPLKD